MSDWIELNCEECDRTLYCDPQGLWWCPVCDNMDAIEGLMRE